MITVRAYLHEPTRLWGFKIFREGVEVYRCEPQYIDYLEAKYEGRKKAAIS